MSIGVVFVTMRAVYIHTCMIGALNVGCVVMSVGSLYACVHA
jgi:hypothetical protein